MSLMKFRNNRQIFTILLIWLAIIFLSMWWNIHQINVFDQEENLATAHSLFSLIIYTSEWNAQMEGVYVPLSAGTEPNPYLKIPERDILTVDGDTLTLINPAYMTRLISEIANKNRGINFHLTSLNPIRPENKPSEWEEQALLQFEEGQQEFFLNSASDQRFYYMAPLLTTESCLACHADQGYKIGDIRGGISVSFSSSPRKVDTVILSHLLIGCLGGVLIVYFGKKVGESIARLEQQTEIDGLTQIYNRHFFDEYFSREFNRAKRTKTSLSLILLDIDYFKLFNDSYGHQNGDECLKTVAKQLEKTLQRPADIAARYGGEEFVIVLPETPISGARIVAENLRAAIEDLKIHHAKSPVSQFVTVSLGVSDNSREEDLSKEDFLRQTDMALYQAKNFGRNNVFVLEEEI